MSRQSISAEDIVCDSDMWLMAHAMFSVRVPEYRSFVLGGTCACRRARASKHESLALIGGTYLICTWPLFLCLHGLSFHRSWDERHAKHHWQGAAFLFGRLLPKVCPDIKLSSSNPINSGKDREGGVFPEHSHLAVCPWVPM